MGSEAKYQLHPWKKPFTLLIVNQNSSSFRKFVKQVSQISAGDGGVGSKKKKECDQSTFWKHLFSPEEVPGPV